MTVLLPEQYERLAAHLAPVCKDWWDADVTVTVCEPGIASTFLSVGDTSITADVSSASSFVLS
jgi:hypothetical protein